MFFALALDEASISSSCVYSDNKRHSVVFYICRTSRTRWYRMFQSEQSDLRVQLVPRTDHSWMEHNNPQEMWRGIRTVTDYCSRSTSPLCPTPSSFNTPGSTETCSPSTAGGAGRPPALQHHQVSSCRHSLFKQYDTTTHFFILWLY